MEIKDPVAKWAFDTLKLYSGLAFPDPNPLQAGALPVVDNAEARFRAFAVAVEVGGRLELAARAGGQLPGGAELLAQVHRTSQEAADADPIRLSLLTEAANEFCTCSSKAKKGAKVALCPACAMAKYIKQAQRKTAPEEPDGRNKE